jgi:hypothetical protein
MKRILTLLATIVLTSAFTYLIVSNHFYRERANKLASELARIEAERVRLAEELERATANQRGQAPSIASESSHGVLLLRQTSAPPSHAESASPSVDADGIPLASPDRESATSAAPPPIVVPLPVSTWIGFVGTTGSVCTVSGHSSAGNWEFESQVIGGYLSLDSRLLNPAWAAWTATHPSGSSLAVKAESTVPVWSLRSKRPVGDSVMDQAVQTLLSEDSQPKIEYRLSELVLMPSGTNLSRALLCHSTGSLVVAGVTNLLKMPVSIEPLARDRLRIVGLATLRMTDFSITPPFPVIRGTTITVEDSVKVSFSWMVARDDRVAAKR